MIRKDSGKGESHIVSVIGVGTKITGDVVFAGGLRIDGEVKGNIRAADGQAARLIVGEHARIEGELKVSRMTINGAVVGQIFASECLELLSQARVTGDIHYTAIEMHPGAVVQGRLVLAGVAVESEGLALANAAFGK